MKEKRERKAHHLATIEVAKKEGRPEKRSDFVYFCFPLLPLLKEKENVCENGEKVEIIVPDTRQWCCTSVNRFLMVNSCG